MWFADDLSEVEFGFLARARSTSALKYLWTFAREARGAVILGMFDLVDEASFSAAPPVERERILRIASEALRAGPILVRPWLNHRFVFMGSADQLSQLETILQDVARRIDRAAVSPRGFTVRYDSSQSMSDQCDRLERAFRTRPKGVVGLDDVPEEMSELAVPCSYSHHFLCNLVAKNRGETLESVLREAVVLRLANVALAKRAQQP